MGILVGRCQYDGEALFLGKCPQCARDYSDSIVVAEPMKYFTVFAAEAGR
jgi:hypothetical protein